MRTINGLAVALALAMGLAGNAAAQGSAGSARFAMGGVNFVMPMPEGYCLPGPDMQPTVEAAAASDTQNKTALTLMSCGPNADPLDYLMIKTPNDFVTVDVTRARLLSSLGPDFDTPVGPNFSLGKAEKEMEGILSEGAGREVDVASALAPRGHDDVCAYLGGTVTSDALDGGVISVGSCLTAIGGRVLAINLYARGGEPATVSKLMRRARALALTITGKKA
ncbi:MAG: hypothetical protein ACAH11_01910 [Sphingomonas sp.]